MVKTLGGGERINLCTRNTESDNLRGCQGDVSNNLLHKGEGQVKMNMADLNKEWFEQT